MAATLQPNIMLTPIRKLNLVSAPINVLGDETATYQSGTVTNGYGSCSGAYVTVQKGTSADVDVKFKIKTISMQSFQKFTTEIRDCLTVEQQHELDEKWANSGSTGGFFSWLFGSTFHNDSSHYVNTHDTYKTDHDTKHEQIAQKVYNLEVQDFQVSGKLKATGTSYIPVTVSAYVQLTKIVFADGKELHVINDTGTVADKNGDTSGVQADNTKLNIIPM